MLVLSRPRVGGYTFEPRYAFNFHTDEAPQLCIVYRIVPKIVECDIYYTTRVLVSVCLLTLGRVYDVYERSALSIMLSITHCRVTKATTISMGV